MMPGSRFLAPVLLTLLFVLLPLSSAEAHQELLGASPEEGAVLTTAPAAIRLTFNQAVEVSLARLTLSGPAGEVALGPLVVAEDAPKVLRASISGPLRAGAYTASWLVTGDDGHVVRGELHFEIAEGAVGLATVDSAATSAAGAGNTGGEPSASPGMEGGAPQEPATELSTGSPLYGAARWLTFAGIVVVIGAVAFSLLLVPGVRRQGDAAPAPAQLERARRRAAVIGMGAAAALLVAAALRLLAQAAALGVGGDRSPARLLQALLTATAWGWAWWLQVGAAVVLVPALMGARRNRRGGWAVAAVAALALAATPALSGHAVATSAVAVVADSLHVVGAGGWLGTLLVLLVAGAPLLLARSEARRSNASALLAAFSPLALSFAALVVLTGIYAAVVHLPDLPALVDSAYGRTLLIKLGLLLIVFGAGAYNWLRARPALQRTGDPRPVRRSAAAEVAVGALVLAVTAALVATPPPDREPAVAASVPVAGAPVAPDSARSGESLRRDPRPAQAEGAAAEGG